MMSGDSPDHCRTDPLLDLKDKPVACTSSNGNAARPAAETIQATVSVEPRPKAQEAVAVCGPADATSVTRRSRSTSTEDEIEMAATPLSPDKNPTECEETLNGPIDATDSDPTKLNSIYGKKENAEQEEEGCGVKCLYYTLQCCECTIM